MLLLKITEQFIDYETGGGKTQKYISTITNKKWTARNLASKEIKDSFGKWIFDFFPNYSVNNASFITIETTNKIIERKKNISLDGLLKSLRYQEQIGAAGEKIALAFEIQRLLDNGIKNANNCVEQVSIKSATAGYDIYSYTKEETRYIEVKSSLNSIEEFYITENELSTLSSLGKKAFLYLVHITDLKNEIGKVYRIFKNPINLLKNKWVLKPIVYKAKIEAGF